MSISMIEVNKLLGLVSRYGLSEHVLARAIYNPSGTPPGAFEAMETALDDVRTYIGTLMEPMSPNDPTDVWEQHAPLNVLVTALREQSDRIQAYRLAIHALGRDPNEIYPSEIESVYPAP